MSNDKTLSELFEEYFGPNKFLEKMRMEAVNNLFDKIKKLKIPPIDPNRDLIAEYYEAMGKKHAGKSVSRRKRNT